MNLLLLAPDIQEEVLALEFAVGRQPVTERTLRGVLREPVLGGPASSVGRGAAGSALKGVPDRT